MIWKYSKLSKRIAEEIINESRLANDRNQWNFYETGSEEYKDGFRIWMKFDADVTHVEF